MLYSFTFFINFICLVTAVWLGVYIVTRSPRSAVAWLTGLTLWSVAGFFLNFLLALSPPLLPSNLPGWGQLLVPFWRIETLDGGWGGWLQGWLVTPAVVFWHHATILMRYGGMNAWRWARVLFGYFIASAVIFLHIKTPWIFLSFLSDEGDPLFLSSMTPGPLYLFTLILLLLFIVMSVVNLTNSARSAPVNISRVQFNVLAVATIIAGLTAPVAFIDGIFDLSLPRVSLSLLLGSSVFVIGYSVARYSAVMEGRTIRRDFTYNAIAMSLIVSVYLGVTWISAQVFNVPAAVFIFVVIIAIVTHSVIDFARRTLDLFFYRQENRQLRSNLLRLASLVGEQGLNESLTLTLDSMCASVRAIFGIVALFKDGDLSTIASFRFQRGKLPISQSDICADDVLHIEQGQIPAPLSEAALIIPLYIETEQIGAVILGRPVNGTHYSPVDVDLLEYLSDHMTESYVDARREEAYLENLAKIAVDGEPKAHPHPKKVRVKDVEDALRNLSDYAYLGDTSLIDLQFVRTRTPDGAYTHVDRGKAVYSVITEAVEKLRPVDGKPEYPIPREWHPYLILHDAYIEDKLNRDIMSRLYISEGTFNRTRRSAIRSVTRVLEEIEVALS